MPPLKPIVGERVFSTIFRWKDGKLDIMDQDDGANGIAFSPDEKYLHVITMRKDQSV
jgi:sugar lactone lactonase YvrE